MIQEGTNKIQTHSNQSSEEELQLLREAAAGDRQATEALLMRYKGLVRRKAGSMFMAGADHEDVIQEGMISLYQAVRDYKPEHCVPFAAFAAFCVTARITDAVRRASRLKHQPLNQSLSLQVLQQRDDQSLQLLDLFADTANPDPEHALLERENLYDLQFFIQKKLSPLEQNVVLTFLENAQYSVIAEKLGCSVKTVDNALRRARQKFMLFRQKNTNLEKG